MNTEVLFQIAAIGIIVALLNQLLNKSERSEQALMVTIAGLIIVILLILGQVRNLFDTMKNLFTYTGR